MKISPTFLIFSDMKKAGLEYLKEQEPILVSVNDVRSIRREFLRRAHANSVYVREWYDDRTSEYQHTWNCLVNTYESMLKELERNIPILIAVEQEKRDIKSGKIKISKMIPKKKPKPVNVQLNIFEQGA